MEQQEFLEKNVFVDLKNVNENFEADNIHQFSEAEFATVLQKCEYFGIGIYTIEAFLNGASFGVSSHDTHNKKATDPKWFKKAFSNFKNGETGMTYAATYKVSLKLLAR
ncbi:hypothetical protein [Cellulophaga baltica]|uniref:hypothetical protein n=1 Tax=Cellulophaga baltica TaxID=76594 RepID=UPI0024942FAF|nr:hypothetical protein [Cellulophaga baltica]